MDALWDPDMFTFRYERTIVDIDQNERTLTIDNPMVMNIDPLYPLRAAKIYHLAHRIPMISDVGVENLRLSKQLSVFQKDTMHAVQINNTIHGWVSDVSTNGFMLGVEVSEFSSFITIQNCKVNCRGRGWHTPVEKRTGFALNGQMSLVNNCTAISAFHDFTSTGPVCGNVLLSHLRLLKLSHVQKDWKFRSLILSFVVPLASPRSQRFCRFKWHKQLRPYRTAQAVSHGFFV